MPRELDTELRFHEWQEEWRRHGCDDGTLPPLPEFGSVETVEYAPIRIPVVAYTAKPSRLQSLTVAVMAFVLFAALVLCFWPWRSP